MDNVQTSGQTRWIRWVLLFILVNLAIVYSCGHLKKKQLNLAAKDQQLQSELDTYRAIRHEINTIESFRKDVERNLKIYHELRKAQESTIQRFTDIIDVVSNQQIDAIQLAQNRTTITIDGRIAVSAILVSTLARIKALPWVGDVKLAGDPQPAPHGLKRSAFSIKIHVDKKLIEQRVPASKKKRKKRKR